MIISLCGNREDKEIVINKLRENYGEKVLVCNYSHLYFNACVENEKTGYDLEKKYDIPTAYEMFRSHINKIVDTRIKDILNTKDKIIVLMGDNILSSDINKTPYFDISDLKILITSEDRFNFDNSYILNHKKLYDKKEFDVILATNDEIDVKKLVKI